MLIMVINILIYDIYVLDIILYRFLYVCEIVVLPTNFVRRVFICLKFSMSLFEKVQHLDITYYFR